MSEKRNDIMMATLKLTNELGFSGTSTDAIIKEANVGKGTIYKYFKNKEELFSILFNELRKKFMARVVSNYDPTLDIPSNFRNTVVLLVNYYVEHEQEFRYLERYSDVSLNIDRQLNESAKLVEPIKQMMQNIPHGIKFKKLPPLVMFAMTYGPLVAIVNLVHMKKIELTDALILEIADSCWESILEK